MCCVVQLFCSVCYRHVLWQLIFANFSSYDRGAKREMYGGSVKLVPEETKAEGAGEGGAADEGGGEAANVGDGPKAAGKGM